MMDLTPPKGLDILVRKVDRCHQLPIKQSNKVFIADEMKVHTLLQWCCQDWSIKAHITCIQYLGRFKAICLPILRCLFGSSGQTVNLVCGRWSHLKQIQASYKLQIKEATGQLKASSDLTGASRESHKLEFLTVETPRADTISWIALNNAVIFFPPGTTEWLKESEGAGFGQRQR